MFKFSDKSKNRLFDKFDFDTDFEIMSRKLILTQVLTPCFWDKFWEWFD